MKSVTRKVSNLVEDLPWYMPFTSFFRLPLKTKKYCLQQQGPILTTSAKLSSIIITNYTRNVPKFELVLYCFGVHGASWGPQFHSLRIWDDFIFSLPYWWVKLDGLRTPSAQNTAPFQPSNSIHSTSNLLIYSYARCRLFSRILQFNLGMEIYLPTPLHFDAWQFQFQARMKMCARTSITLESAETISWRELKFLWTHYGNVCCGC